MICQAVHLGVGDATLHPICLTNTPELKLSPRRAVIVCPGGGYGMLSDREAEPIAAQFLAAGFATFILHYGVGEAAADYLPLKQVAAAVRYVRTHAADYCVDARYVFTCGFSAGGHLAASAGVLWQHPCLGAECADGMARPTGMILAYPVITAGEFAHRGSILRLCGKEQPTEAEMTAFSLEKQVDATTPPAFLWHTFSDATVPVQNSLLLAEAMTAAGVPFELHIFPEGVHGLSLCNEITACGKENKMNAHCEIWMELAIRWAKELEA